MTWSRVLLLAVHPEHQNLGIGTTLNTYALDEMRTHGVQMVKVETGGSNDTSN